MKDIIGVFDSGIGGLTVLQTLASAYPNQDFIYLADTKNVPYGTKQNRVLEEIVNDNINYLISREVKAIIIACNTASSVNLRKTSIPVFKIVEPTALIANTLSKKVGVLATNYTIESKAYEKFLKIVSIGVKCSEFVDYIEAGMINTDELFNIIKSKVDFLNGEVDSIILGCTHFNLISNQIRKILPDIRIIDSSLSMVESIKNIVSKQSSSGKIEIVNTSLNSLKIDWFNLDYKLTFK